MEDMTEDMRQLVAYVELIGEELQTLQGVLDVSADFVGAGNSFDNVREAMRERMAEEWSAPEFVADVLGMVDDFTEEIFADYGAVYAFIDDCLEFTFRGEWSGGSWSADEVKILRTFGGPNVWIHAYEGRTSVKVYGAQGGNVHELWVYVPDVARDMLAHLELVEEI